MDRYGLVREDGSGNNLSTMLSNLYGTGSLLDVTITVKKVGSRPLCQAKNKYDSACRSVLNLDGTCPDADYHVVEEVEVAA